MREGDLGCGSTGVVATEVQETLAAVVQESWLRKDRRGGRGCGGMEDAGSKGIGCVSQYAATVMASKRSMSHSAPQPGPSGGTMWPSAISGLLTMPQVLAVSTKPLAPVS